MGYYLVTEPDPPLTYEQTKECIEYLLQRSGERFSAEFGSGNLDMELDAETRTVRVWRGKDERTYSFDSLI